MSKSKKIKKSDIAEDVMTQIMSNKIVMKPRWYYVLGTVLSLVGLICSSFVAIFLTNLTIFMLKQHGPNGSWRLQQILESFPFWVPILAVVGMVGGVWLLKKYDFSYQKNFKSIIGIFVATILLTAALLDYTGLSSFWMKKEPMRRFYQQQNNSDTNSPQRGGGQGYRRYNK